MRLVFKDSKSNEQMSTAEVFHSLEFAYGACVRHRNRGDDASITDKDIEVIQLLQQELVTLIGSKKPRVSTTKFLLPNDVLIRVVGMLGTPPSISNSVFFPATFLQDVTSMAQVCRQWNKVVHSSPIWKAICEWRFPWLVGEGEEEERQKVLCQLPKQHESWYKTCARIGRVLHSALPGHDWMSDYQIVMEVFEKGGPRLVSVTGRFHLREENEHNDDDTKTRFSITYCNDGFETQFNHDLFEPDRVLVPNAIQLGVVVMLVNRHSKKVSRICSSNNTFQRDDFVIYDDDTVSCEFPPLATPGPERFEIKPYVEFHHPENRACCWLYVFTPKWFTSDAFCPIVKNWTWV